MKTGTLTFHAPNNNGSFLQAYALQRILIDHGIEFRKPREKEDFIRNIISLFHYHKMKYRFDRFEKMRNKYLILTKRFKKAFDVYNELEKYDVIICGSDQIWNTAARDFCELYLLPNVKNKKITYAISCGSKIDTSSSKMMFECAKKFQHTYFREDTTTMLFKEHGIINATTVCDPTLLLSSKEYSMLIKPKRIIEGDYIFLYTIDYNDQVLKTAVNIGKATGYKVIAAFTGYSVVKCYKYGIKVIYDMTPDTFLNLIENANIVCSNSFHGIVFSIIFHKEFYRGIYVNENGNIKKDDRIDGLLEYLEISNVNKKCNSSFSHVKIDYDYVDTKISKLKKDSLDYLFRAINE